MTGEEINQKINENNDRIEQLLVAHNFILNTQVNELIQQNKALQESCSHNFQNGCCKYCYKEEEKNGNII